MVHGNVLWKWQLIHMHVHVGKSSVACGMYIHSMTTNSVDYYAWAACACTAHCYIFPLLWSTWADATQSKPVQCVVLKAHLISKCVFISVIFWLSH